MAPLTCWIRTGSSWPFRVDTPVGSNPVSPNTPRSDRVNAAPWG